VEHLCAPSSRADGTTTPWIVRSPWDCPRQRFQTASYPPIGLACRGAGRVKR
jgi:hypothetical protein